MRVKGTCRSANGGGVPFCMLAIYQTGIHSLLLPDSSTTPQGQKGIELGQKGSKWIIFWCALVFSRDFRRPKRAKVKYILGLGLSWCVSSCPLGAGGALLLPLFGCVPSLSPCLCPLSCFACRVACEYGFISRFKGVLAGFGVRMYACIGWGLCVDCGAFVCVSG